MDFIISFNGNICYCLALKSENDRQFIVSLILNSFQMAHDINEFHHQVRLCFLCLLSCSNKLRNCLLLQETMTGDSPITKSIGTFNLCRKKVLLLYLGPWFPSRLGTF